VLARSDTMSIDGLHRLHAITSIVKPRRSSDSTFRQEAPILKRAVTMNLGGLLK
jgi:hypothetical protein